MIFLFVVINVMVIILLLLLCVLILLYETVVTFCIHWLLRYIFKR